jgi:hypothetical protein
MPNFTAYATRQAVSSARLHPTAERVNNVRRHLLTLGPDAPAALHLQILETDAALETANKAA